VTETATPKFKGRLGVALEDTDRGVVIAAVAPQSPASRAELRPGDLIVELDGKKITDAATLVASVANVPEHKAVVARVVRGTTTRFVGIELA
jgi:S1-C subfamily serine protease